MLFPLAHAARGNPKKNSTFAAELKNERIMTQKQSIQLFEERNVRTIWDDVQEKWYFSVVDVIAILTDSPTPRNYWKVLKNRLKKEGNESVTNCNQLKLLAADGKRYLTDVADQEQLFRIIQSVPSPKEEPFKQWMAKVASDRLDQMQDPDLSIQQAIAGNARKEIEERLGHSVISSAKATDYLPEKEIKQIEEW